MPGKVPVPILTTLVTTVHHHPTPACNSTYHHKTCTRPGVHRESGCVRLTPTSKKGPRMCLCIHTRVK
jgi:hypothetical protein